MHARHELLLRLAYHAAECSREAGLRHTPHSASRPARQCSAAAATECQAAVATGAVHQREWAQAQWGRVQAAVIAAAGASAAAALAVSTSQANCDAPLQEAADEVSNKHTAKFRIFADKARRCTVEGRYVEAEQWWEKAKAEAIQGFGGRTAQLAVIANGLAEVYRLAGGERFERAEALYRESIEIVEREYGASDARYAQAVQYLGQYLSDAGRHEEALAQLHKAADVKRQTLGKNHIEVANVVALTADTHRAAGNLRAAVQCYEQSLATLATSGHDEGSAASKTRARLVDTLLEGGDAERALAVVEGMLSYARNVHITEHGVTMCALEKVVDALSKKGRADRVIRAAQTMLEVRVSAFGLQSVPAALPRRVLASALLDATGANRHTLAALEAHLAAQALTKSVVALRKEVDLYRHIPGWMFWRRAPENLEFMKLRVTVEAIELAKALLVLDKPAARANARYAASLRSYDRADGHVPPEATSVDTEESEKSLQLCKSLLEEPERILEPWETVDGAPAVRVPRRQAYKVEKARLEALSQLLDMLIARAQQQRGPPERPPAHRLVQDSMRGSGDRGGGGVDESAEVGELAPLRRQRTQVQAALDALPEAVDAPE